MHMSANALAHAIGVPANRVSGILAGARSVTADTALRLAQAFQTSPEFWLNMQQSYDLQLAAKTAKIAKKIQAIIDVSRPTRTVARRESFGVGLAAKRKPSPRRTKVA